MPTSSSESPFEAPRAVAGFAIAALFTGVGVTMIDPRTGFGITLCVLGLAFTVMLFLRDILAMRLDNKRRWPWIGLFLILFEIVAPIYVAVSKAEEVSKPSNPSTGQQGGQTGGGNVGPTYNGPFIDKRTMLRHGPVTVNNEKDCPPEFTVLSGNIANNNGKSGFSMPADADVCLVNNKAEGNGDFGYEFRPNGR